MSILAIIKCIRPKGNNQIFKHFLKLILKLSLIFLKDKPQTNFSSNDSQQKLELTSMSEIYSSRNARTVAHYIKI